MMQSGITQAREIDDPPGLHEKTEYLLREWVNMYHSPAAGRDSTKAFGAFVQQVSYILIFILLIIKCLKNYAKSQQEELYRYANLRVGELKCRPDERTLLFCYAPGLTFTRLVCLPMHAQ
jgi:hypothetical protein